jgi:hypothetical protein
MAAQNRLGLPFSDTYQQNDSGLWMPNAVDSIYKMPICYHKTNLYFKINKGASSYAPQTGLWNIGGDNCAGAYASANAWVTLVNMTGSGFISNLISQTGNDSTPISNAEITYKITIDDVVETIKLKVASDYNGSSCWIFGYTQPGQPNYASISAVSSVEQREINGYDDGGFQSVGSNVCYLNDVSFKPLLSQQGRSLVTPQHIIANQVPAIRFNKNAKVEYLQNFTSAVSGGNYAAVLYKLDIKP